MKLAQSKRSAVFTLLLAWLALVTSCAHIGGEATPDVDGGSELEDGEGVETSEAQRQAFSIAVLPDTQHYVEWWKPNTPVFHAQTEWLAEHAKTENIAFVSHVGDIVENGHLEFEWRRASAAMNRLDGKVKYSTLPGNHDYGEKDNRAGGAPLYNKYFGRGRYAKHPWIRLSPNQHNSVAHFRAGGHDFLHLALEWEASDETLTWARGVLARNPDVPTIVSTHAFLNPGGELAVQNLTADAGGNSGRALWNEFIRQHDQIFMVLNGHFADTSRKVLINDAGHRVFAMLADYSFDLDKGGNGFLRLIEFDEANQSLQVTTYSPYLDHYLDGPANAFRFPFDFNQRFPNLDD